MKTLLLIIFTTSIVNAQNVKFYVHNEEVFIGVKTMLDQYFDECERDSIQIRYCGELDLRTKDTVWIKTDNPYCILEKIVKVKKEPSFADFKKWLDKYFER